MAKTTMTVEELKRHLARELIHTGSCFWTFDAPTRQLRRIDAKSVLIINSALPEHYTLAEQGDKQAYLEALLARIQSRRR